MRKSTYPKLQEGMYDDDDEVNKYYYYLVDSKLRRWKIDISPYTPLRETDLYWTLTVAYWKHTGDVPYRVGEGPLRLSELIEMCRLRLPKYVKEGILGPHIDAAATT